MVVGAVGALVLVGGGMFLAGRASSAPTGTTTPAVPTTAPTATATAAPLASLVPADPTAAATAAATTETALAPLAPAKPPATAAAATTKIRGKRYNFACPKGTEPNGAVRGGCLCDSQILNPCAAGFSDIEETAWGCWFTCE